VIERSASPVPICDFYDEIIAHVDEVFAPFLLFNPAEQKMLATLESVIITACFNPIGE
jgi:hypothetical protein